MMVPFVAPVPVDTGNTLRFRPYAAEDSAPARPCVFPSFFGRLSVALQSLETLFCPTVTTVFRTVKLGATYNARGSFGQCVAPGPQVMLNATLPGVFST